MECHELPFSASLTLPPLSVLFLEVPSPAAGKEAAQENVSEVSPENSGAQ